MIGILLALAAQDRHDTVGETQQALRLQRVADRDDDRRRAERSDVTPRAARQRIEQNRPNRQVGRSAHRRTGDLRRNLVVDRHHVDVDEGRRIGFVALDGLGDARHRLDRLHGIGPRSGLVAQHDGVDPLVDGAGDIAHLGARRTRRTDHRVEHLRGDDDRTFGGDALVDDHPLRDGDDLGRQLDAQVAARHHDAVGGFDDLVDVVDSLLVLDLRDDLDAAVPAVENRLHGFDVARAAHERVGDEIDAVLRGPLDVHAVFLGHRRQVDRHVGDVDALARTQRAVAHDAADQFFGRFLFDMQFHFAVGDEHRGPRRHVAHDVLDIHVDHLARRGNIGFDARPAHLHPVARRKADAV